MWGWTGERYIPGVGGPHYDHQHRYVLARELAHGRSVVDLASGEGYGAAWLAAVAEHVVGVDLAPEAVEHARTQYATVPNLAFVRGDICRLPLAARTADLIVCFEALEHVVDHDALLTEIERLLRPDGLLVISTPDRRVYSEELGHTNEFHQHELYLEEFEELLRSRFAGVVLLGQRTIAASCIWPLDGEVAPGRLYATKSLVNGDDVGPYLAPTYAVAVCAHHQSALTGARSLSLYSDADQTFMDNAERVSDLVAHYHSALEAQENEFRASLTEALETQESRAATTEALETQANEFRASLTEALETQANEIRASLTEALETQENQYRSSFTKAQARFDDRVAAYESRLEAQASALEQAERSLDALRATRVFRYSAGARAVYGRLRGLRGRRVPQTEAARPLRLETIRLPHSSLPRVSIVMPVHGKVHLTECALRAISENTEEVEFEVVIVDDASPDTTLEMLARVPNARVVEQKTNVGFLRACNAGAAVSRGEYLVLLNNDTEVRPGWLKHLVDTADGNPDVGIVGAKLVSPDGFLQEAGGIVWCDGAAMNFGRGDDANKAEYNFVRDVDYCSAACLLVRRELFTDLGGFDARYAPGYYEDVDLAFAARVRGYRVVYQPKAVVVHIEGGSHGTDPLKGTKRFQAINRVAFREKWRTELMRQLAPPTSPRHVLAGRERVRRGRVLVVVPTVPTWDQDAGSLRLRHILRMLTELRFSVTLFAEFDGRKQPYVDQLEQSGIEILVDISELLGYLRQFGDRLDLCLLVHCDIAVRHLRMIRELAPHACAIFDTVDLASVRLHRYSELSGTPGAAASASVLREFELALTRASDAVFATTGVDKQLIQLLVPESRVFVMPTIHATQDPGPGFDERTGILFVGGYQHLPNVDAARFLVEDIMVLLRGRLPGVRLTIAGSNAPEEVLLLASDDVDVVGWVPDLTPLYRRARAFVAPVRFGSGMKGKIAESLSFGLPVVTTAVGAEGMELDNGSHLLVSDEPEEFVEKIARLYTDRALWTLLSVEGRHAVSDLFSPEAAKTRLEGILDDLDIAPNKSVTT